MSWRLETRFEGHSAHPQCAAYAPVSDARPHSTRAGHRLIGTWRAWRQVPGGVGVLLKACPEGIEGISKDEIYKELHELRGRLPEGKKDTLRMAAHGCAWMFEPGSRRSWTWTRCRVA